MLVFFVQKDILSVIAPRSYVVDRLGKLDAPKAGHVDIMAETLALVKP